MKYVAFDLGASSGKLFEGKIEGDQLKIEAVYDFPNEIVRLGNGMYWDFMRIYSELCIGLRKSEARGRIHSLGIDSFNNDFSLIDASGELLIPLRSYRDPRTQRYWKDIFAKMSEKEVYMYSGNQIAPFNTLMQLSSMNLCGQGFLLKNAHRLLMLPDLLGYYITGRECMEYTLAAETELLDLKKKKWIDEILECYNVPRNLLPELHMPGTILGPSTPEFNRQNHLQGFDFVNVCEHDTASAFLASPLGRDAAFISSGTWALVGVETDQPVINEFTYQNNLANEGGMDGHHRVLKNVMGSWIIQELRRDYALDGKNFSYPEIAQAAMSAEPFRFPLDPDDPLLYLPGNMRNKIREVSMQANSRAPETPGEIFRCVYEALVMKYRRSIELLERAVGRSYSAINIFGGGCQDGLCNQFTANACGKKVVAGPINASSVGNILVQMMAHGELKSVSQARELVGRSYELMEYQPKDTKAWDEHYGEYLKCFEAEKAI